MPKDLPKTAAEAVATMSCSKTEGWFRCQFQWFLNRVLGIRKPPSSYFAFGRATDTTAATFYDGKIESGEDMTEDDTVGLWREQWREEAQKVDDWDDDAAEAKITDKGVPAIARWREKIATQVVPTKTKLWFELMMEGVDEKDNWTLNGEIDLLHRPKNELHREPIPSDTKMSTKRWSAKQAFQGYQPSVYSVALDHAPDVESNGSLFQYHVSILYDPKKKRASTDAAQVITRQVTQEEKDGALARIAMARRQIKHAFETGDFLPNRQATTCTRRHCGHWEECEKRFGPRVPD